MLRTQSSPEKTPAVLSCRRRKSRVLEDLTGLQRLPKLPTSIRNLLSFAAHRFGLFAVSWNIPKIHVNRNSEETSSQINIVRMSQAVESSVIDHEDCFSVGSDCSCQSSLGSCSRCEEEEFSGTLPTGWHRAWDESGHVYYWNEKTRESRWSLRGVPLETEDFEKEAEKSVGIGKDAAGCHSQPDQYGWTGHTQSLSPQKDYQSTSTRHGYPQVDTGLHTQDHATSGRGSQHLRSPVSAEQSSTVLGSSDSSQSARSPLATGNSSAEEKRLHNEMKQRLSSLVIQGLLPFHLGSSESRLSGEPPRIGTSVDFKKLARKLTHTVQEKEEAKARAKGAPLRINDRVRTRVRDYVQGYVKQHCDVLQTAPSAAAEVTVVTDSPSSDSR